MPIKTRIKLTGSIGFVAFILWILSQFVIMIGGILKWISGIVFLLAVIWVIWDASHGGFTD